jgi:hypothetical protein
VRSSHRFIRTCDEDEGCSLYREGDAHGMLESRCPPRRTPGWMCVAGLVSGLGRLRGVPGELRSGIALGFHEGPRPTNDGRGPSPVTTRLWRGTLPRVDQAAMPTQPQSRRKGHTDYHVTTSAAFVAVRRKVRAALSVMALSSCSRRGDRCPRPRWPGTRPIQRGCVQVDVCTSSSACAHRRRKRSYSARSERVQ